MKAGNAKNSVASVCVSNYNKLGAVFIFVKEGKIMQEKEKGGFSFINEQIKEKPLKKKTSCKKSIVYGSACRNFWCGGCAGV